MIIIENVYLYRINNAYKYAANIYLWPYPLDSVIRVGTRHYDILKKKMYWGFKQLDIKLNGILSLLLL